MRVVDSAQMGHAGTESPSAGSVVGTPSWEKSIAHTSSLLNAQTRALAALENRLGRRVGAADDVEPGLQLKRTALSER